MRKRQQAVSAALVHAAARNDLAAIALLLAQACISV